jgi:glycosyltransferase involved in cell wall biosynthesis
VKVLEAMAMGVPVVSTPLGCEGLDVVDGRSALIAGCDQEMADAIVRVLRRPSLSASLVDAGFEVARRYDWQRIGGVLDRVIRAAASPPSAGWGKA